ncbi:MAG TPA: VOC family protein, partial [Acidimicrobiales bacterium]|nr:VOC family protein [Acidimicrobiales bacterium]
MAAEDQFHVGIVVDDLDATLAQLSDLFGYAWCEQIAAPTSVSLPDGDAVLDFRITYSMNTPRLEIIQAMPGTLWVPAAGSGIHHIGYWSNDVARAAGAADPDALVQLARTTLTTLGGAPDGTDAPELAVVDDVKGL